MRRLLAANALMYLASQVYPVLFYQLLLIPAMIPTRPWTLITYMFLHGGLAHILFNMIALYFFGSRVELRLGSRHFILLYLISGITGGLLSLVFTPRAYIIGASGAVFGVSFAFAYFWPRDRIYIWGVLPIEARWLVILTAGIAIFGGFTGAQGGVAHFAHLGGYVGAWFYLWWITRRATAGRRAWQAKVSAPAGTVDSRRLATIDLTRVHPVNRDEVNRILDKINASGLDSLTGEERTFLSHFAGPERSPSDVPPVQ
ncbi:MAG: rhomboid family intramembrane serine protease [Gemmatimonadota bacterium]|nr:rhomboid family intramembrane serine protease [Gemmatimonadota bacterium]